MESVRFRRCTFLSIFVVLLSTCSAQTTTTVSSSSTTTYVSGGTIPVDMTAAAGSTVTFWCAPGTAGWVAWAVGTASNIVYSSPSRDNIAITNPKYSLSGQYNLVVSGIDPAVDGVTYMCQTAPMTYNLANLLVVDESQFSVSVSTGSAQLSVGQVVTFTCSVRYGAPTTDTNSGALKPLTSQQDPMLTLTLDNGETLPETSGVYIQPTGGSGIHVKTLTVNHTVRASDAGKSLYCSVTSLTYSKTLTQMLDLPSGPTKVNITYNNTQITSGVTLSPGQQIYCNANGYPSPTVTWVPVSPTSGLTAPSCVTRAGSCMMTISSVAAAQTWNCVATNQNGSMTLTFNFNLVGGASTGAPDTKPSNNNVGLGVGIGIGIGVPVLIAIIVIIIVLMRRKKQKSSGDDVTKSKPPPPSTGTGKPPINEPHRPQRPPSTHNGPSINPNPNPTYALPVYPEQVSGSTAGAPPKTTPDRPGYGDLGVGHIHAGGSTPSLNRSMESSHAGDDFHGHDSYHGGHIGPNTDV